MISSLLSVTCIRNVCIANDVHELRFTKPTGFHFTPGQFVLFQVPLKDDPNNLQPRAFSIASAPDEEWLLFAMKLKKEGRSSIWIRDVVRPGTEALMQGPMGVFTVDRNTKKDYLLIGTSTGVTPFRSQLFSFLPLLRNRIDLVFGAYKEEDLFWVEEFENLAKKYENFFFHVALSNPSLHWKRHRGYVQTLVPKICADFSNKKIYACGNPDMVRDVRRLASEKWGVSSVDIHVESYL